MQIELLSISSRLFLFIKIFFFFAGVTIFCAYFIHRLYYYYSCRSLARLFPNAFDLCFESISEFWEMLSATSYSESNRFINQMITRKRFSIPRQFKDMPINIAKTCYLELRKMPDTFKKEPKKVIEKIRHDIYQQYMQRFRFRILNESHTWMIGSIPIVFILGFLSPTILYFFFPDLFIDWPLSLTISGLFSFVGVSILIIRDYYFHR